MTELNNAIFFAFNHFAGQSAAGDFLIVFFANHLAYILAAVFLAALVFWKVSRSEKIKLTVSAAVAAILSRGVAVEAIRFFYHHPRPFITLSEARQLFPETGYSFPSGHATLFFALSAVIYCYHKKAGTAFFALSAIMGLARIAAGVHYPLDILGGAVIGSLIGFGVVWMAKHFVRGYIL